MEKNDQKKVNRILKRIIGMRLYRVYRADDMPCIVFTKDGSAIEDGDFHIHAQCPVRIANHGTPLLAVNDMYLPGTGITQEEFDRDCDKRPISLYDECAQKLEQAGLVVAGARCTRDGDLLIAFRDGSRMTVFPIGSNKDEEWRLIDLTIDMHAVYSGNGAFDMDE